jgi:hypothetical protein
VRAAAVSVVLVIAAPPHVVYVQVPPTSHPTR